VDGARATGQNQRPVGITRQRTLVAAALAGALALALAMAGCGGGGTAKAYTVAATKACLEKGGIAIVPVDEANDFVAASALAGALGAKLALNRVTIAFGRDAAEGELIEKAYAQYGSKDVPIDQVLERKDNAVLLWAGAPTGQDAKAVRSCLKS
jgi:hypothetical protein